MILQRILFPDVTICDREQMYFVNENVLVDMKEKSCVFEKGGKCSTNTYFNSISIGKWKKYTLLDNLSLILSLKGSFLIHVCHVTRLNGELKRKVIATENFFDDNVNNIQIPFEISESSGIYYLELVALENNSKLFGGYYETSVSTEKQNDIKIAVGICTYKREQYVYNNINILKDLCENQNSVLFNKLEIYISDNGKTLDKQYKNGCVHIFPNKNAGGAAGFTRAIIEILKEKNKKNITHILLMDDDIRINPDSLIRTYNLLTIIKPQYKDAFIGGHMLKLDEPNIQSEAADHWDVVKHHPVKYNYDLENENSIIKNEIEDSVNYFSWWYCCMPLNIINESNLPLPLFIKRDDIEYGLRNGRHFITLNGICVWHEPFNYKTSAHLEYYYFRNMCIINAKHRKNFTKKVLLKELKSRLSIALLRYRYREAEMELMGIEDFLKGIDWLKEQDGEFLNTALMNLGYKKEKIDDLRFNFTHGIYEKNLNYTENKVKKVKRLLSLNGWLLKANKNVIVPSYQPSTALFYRARRALNYEEISNTGYVTEKSYRALFYILKRYFRVKKNIKHNFDKVILEYRNRFDELTNLEFWEEYLDRNKKSTEINSELPLKKKPKNTFYQYKQFIRANVLKILQAILFVVPVKKSRVMIQVHERKGFTCNPKYIAKKIIENYSEQAEIIWVTRYPETCDEIKNLGITVVGVNTWEHVKMYIRTRFYVTNDSFPEWALHKWNQKWMNLWHGSINYKHIGYDYLAPMSNMRMRVFKMQNRQPDFFVAGSAFFENDTAQSFRLNKSVFIRTGLPRNDLFFEQHNELEVKIRNLYGIAENDKIVMFAPTFRRGMKSDTYDLDFDMVKLALHNRFGGKWIVLFRNHNFVKSQGDNYGDDVIDVSNYADMQELLYITDVLISDYSSCMYDFSLTKRPCFVYAPDLKNYITNDRAFAYPIEKWPYSIANNNNELKNNILKFNTEQYEQNIDQHFNETGSFDNGTASQQVVEIINKYCNW